MLFAIGIVLILTVGLSGMAGRPAIPVTSLIPGENRTIPTNPTSKAISERQAPHVQGACGMSSPEDQESESAGRREAQANERRRLSARRIRIQRKAPEILQCVRRPLRRVRSGNVRHDGPGGQAWSLRRLRRDV